MKIGIGQFDCKFDDKKYNLRKVADIVNSKPADIWVFPEMAITGYMIQSTQELDYLAEDFSQSSSINQLTKIAQDNNSVIVIGLPEKENGELFNTAVVVDNVGLLTKNQKSHLFLNEKKYFSSGRTGTTSFELDGIKIGLGVCYDYMFPEYWRKLALEGADLFINTANYVFRYGFYMMKARAIENGVFSACVNRVGEERGQIFFGESELVDNRGKTVYQFGNKEESKVLDIDPILSRDKNWNKMNNLFDDRREEIY